MNQIQQQSFVIINFFVLIKMRFSSKTFLMIESTQFKSMLSYISLSSNFKCFYCEVLIILVSSTACEIQVKFKLFRCYIPLSYEIF